MRYNEIMIEANEPDRENWSRFDWDTDDENRRILGAYLKRHRLDPNDFSVADWENAQAEALSHRHLYPIPTTDTDYLYHGTSKERIGYIKHQGLVPQYRTRWVKSGYGLHAKGRIFFTDTVMKALSYAGVASRIRPALTRVRREFLPDIHPDPKETEGSYFIERAVPVNQVEVWNGKTWVDASSLHRRPR
jgi:hypothetical protein